MRNGFNRPVRVGVVLAGLLACAAVAQPPKDAPPPPPPAVQELPAKPPAWLAGYRVRWPLRVAAADLTKEKQQTVLASVPTGGWLKPDASDIAVQAASGEVLPATVVSHDPLGDTLIQFQRKGNEPWYWAYGGSDKPLSPPKLDPKEGLSLELRDWAGDDIGNWAKVTAGLKKSEAVVGNAIAAEVNQTGNPARWERPNKFAASYRGFLDIKKDGTYRFYANADDAAFVFVNGFKVFEKAGENQYLPQTKQKDLLEKCGKIELKAGVHPFEVHHVVGNNPQSQGVCALLWQPEGETQFTFVPRTAFVQPLIARTTQLEGAPGTTPVAFAHGIDDSLSSGAVKVYLVRFEAHGDVKEPDKLVWDFGDGTTGTGRSVVHAYFAEGDRTVTLAAPGSVLFKRRVDVWSVPGVSSPFSLGKAVRSVAACDWRKAGPDYARQVLAFLQACDEPGRWPPIDAIAAFLLTQPNLELEDRIRLTVARMEALAATGKPNDAIKLAADAEKDAAKVPSLVLAVKLAFAAVHQYRLNDPAAASKQYKAMLDDFRRVEHPNLRVAAIRWGDLYADAGDLPKAGEAYRLAATLGGEKFAKTAQVDAVTRGAQLRIAEQRLRAGDVRQTRYLLEQIEINYPEQKLEGHYRFLRAEADRLGGRYEEAVRNYEVLARLPQWAGYRDRAVHGIADANYRMGDLAKSLEWYGTLKANYADYFTKQKLDDVVKLIAARNDRVKAARAKGDKVLAFTPGFDNGLTPGDGAITPFTNFPYARGLGPAGQHVGALDNITAATLTMYVRPIRDLNPDGPYWAEFWYREHAGGINYPASQLMYSWVAGDGDPNPQNPLGAPFYIDRTFGKWRKAGFRVTAPRTDGGQVRFAVNNFQGVMEVTGFTFRPIGDRENDALTAFLEGTEMP